MVEIQEMLQAGGHFGHRKSKWNPKMAEFIFMERNGIHIIDVRKTQQRLKEACEQVRRTAASGTELLMVGTKHQARDVVGRYAEKVDLPYVNYRWMGGMLTNFATMKKSIKRLENLNALLDDEATEEKYTKKEMLIFERKRDKLKRNLSGMVKLKKMPGIVFVVDTKIENIAVQEARKLNIPVIAIVDTISNPTPIDFPVPFNDDGMRSIELIVREIVDAYEQGKQEHKEKSIRDRGKKETRKKSFGDETRNVAGRKVRVKRLAGKKEEDASEAGTDGAEKKDVKSSETPEKTAEPEGNDRKNGSEEE